MSYLELSLSNTWFSSSDVDSRRIKLIVVSSFCAEQLALAFHLALVKEATSKYL